MFALVEIIGCGVDDLGVVLGAVVREVVVLGVEVVFTPELRIAPELLPPLSSCCANARKSASGTSSK